MVVEQLVEEVDESDGNEIDYEVAMVS